MSRFIHITTLITSNTTTCAYFFSFIYEGVVSPASSGIGGGCFILNYDYRLKASTFIDSRENAPSASSENMFISDPMQAQDGGLAIATIAELKGLEKAYQTLGSGANGMTGITWERLVRPAAELAEGWKIGEVTAKYIKNIEKQLLSGLFPGILLLHLHLFADIMF